MYLIYRCLSSASAVIRSWFVYELHKSTTIAFSRTHSTLSTPEIQPVKSPPCLRISNRKYPPCPQNSIIVNLPSPSEILKAVRGIGMDIFWNHPLWTVVDTEARVVIRSRLAAEIHQLSDHFAPVTSCTRNFRFAFPRISFV